MNCQMQAPSPRWCYPLYASHALILYAVLRVTTQAGWGAVPALAVALCVVLTVAVLLHLLVERPSQRLGRRLARGAGPAPSGQAGAARSVFARLGARLAEW